LWGIKINVEAFSNPCHRNRQFHQPQGEHLNDYAGIGVGDSMFVAGCLAIPDDGYAIVPTLSLLKTFRREQEEKVIYYEKCIDFNCINVINHCIMWKS